MSLSSYPKYKDSGIEWLGGVPEDWEVKRLRYVVDLNPSKSEVAALGRDTLVSFLPMEAIGEDGSLRLDQQRSIAEVESGYTYLRDGDVAVAKITPCFENGKGAVMSGLTNGTGFGTTELIVGRPKPSVTTSAYLHMLFMSREFRQSGESHMYGAGGQKRVSDTFVRNFTMAFPPINEQFTIVRFLTSETEKIDALIAEQQRLIALLQEKRRAVISHAVTKGLNPDSAMKPSGVQWLGDVPVHWEVVRLRFLCDIQTGSRDTENAVENGRYQFFVRSQTVETIDTVAFNGEAVLTAGDGAGVGKVFHHFVGAFDFHQRVYMLNNFRFISGKLLFFFLKENFYKVALEGGAKSTVDSLRRPMLTNFWVCVPPADEQAGIVQAIERDSTRFDCLTSEAERAITLLKERRIALISAAVTGKIDVRSYARTRAA